jgi:hypothetical protein
MLESRPIRQEITVQNCSPQEVYEFVDMPVHHTLSGTIH